MTDTILSLFGDAGFTIAHGRYQHVGGLTCDASDPAWFTFGAPPTRGQSARGPWTSVARGWRADLPASYLIAAGVEGWPAVHAWLQSSLAKPGALPAAWAPPSAADLDAWWPTTERTLQAGPSVRTMDVLAGPDLLTLRVPLTALPEAGPARTIATSCLHDWQASARMVRSAWPDGAPAHLEVALAGAPAPLEPLVLAAVAALRAATTAILPALEVLTTSAPLADHAFLNDVAAWWHDGGERNTKNNRRRKT